ncbi:MAG: AmmeMemoRadiSam system protein B [Pseudomonadota bacterium]
MQQRPAIFAAQGWYPADPGQCLERVEFFLRSAATEEPASMLGGIVPHAGWSYSGQTAARTFGALAGLQPELVLLFGGHLRPRDTALCMTRGAFATPLGPLPVEESLARELVATFPVDEEMPDHFAADNTIELQLPFVRHLWPRARVLAVQVPADESAAVLGRWLAERTAALGLRTLAIGSTDLTHYGTSYGFTPQGVGDEAHAWSMRENDGGFLERVLALDGQGASEHALAHHSACCPGATAATLAFVNSRGGVRPRLVEHTTSHLVRNQGSPQMWVGYASVVF